MGRGLPGGGGAGLRGLTVRRGWGSVQSGRGLQGGGASTLPRALSKGAGWGGLSGRGLNTVGGACMPWAGLSPLTPSLPQPCRLLLWPLPPPPPPPPAPHAPPSRHPPPTQLWGARGGPPWPPTPSPAPAPNAFCWPPTCKPACPVSSPDRQTPPFSHFGGPPPILGDPLLFWGTPSHFGDPPSHRLKVGGPPITCDFPPPVAGEVVSIGQLAALAQRPGGTPGGATPGGAKPLTLQLQGSKLTLAAPPLRHLALAPPRGLPRKLGDPPPPYFILLFFFAPYIYFFFFKGLPPCLSIGLGGGGMVGGSREWGEGPQLYPQNGGSLSCTPKMGAPSLWDEPG